MGKAKRFFLLNERRETWRMTLQEQRTAYCSQCGRDVDWLTTHDAMLLLNITELAIIKLTGAADVHSQEDDRGFLFFCKTSLEKLRAQELDHERD